MGLREVRMMSTSGKDRAGGNRLRSARVPVIAVPLADADAEAQRAVRFIRTLHAIFGEDQVLDFELPPTDSHQEMNP
jgi:hypothetical protein